MMQWSPSGSIEFISPLGNQTSLYLRPTSSAPGTHIAYWPDPTTQKESPEQGWQRILCFYLVSEMPAKGLDELSETLGELYEHYYRQFNRPPMLPEAPTPVRARRGQQYDRPEFHAVEE